MPWFNDFPDQFTAQVLLGHPLFSSKGHDVNTATTKQSAAPEAYQVIFNPPATIVYWMDGTKTVVKCDNDDFSEEFGFAMACVKKLYGTRSRFKNQFKYASRPYLKPTDGKEHSV